MKRKTNRGVLFDTEQVVQGFDRPSHQRLHPIDARLEGRPAGCRDFSLKLRVLSHPASYPWTLDRDRV